MRETEQREREALQAKLAEAKRLQAFRAWVHQERGRQAELAAAQQREQEARLVRLLDQGHQLDFASIVGDLASNHSCVDVVSHVRQYAIVIM